jgi:hypothetical protein
MTRQEIAELWEAVVALLWAGVQGAFWLAVLVCLIAASV